MKKIIFSLLSILNVAIISAQDQCLTSAPEPPKWIFNTPTRSLLTSTSYSMNIFVHIVRSSNGQGLGTGILSTIVNSLNSNFQDADIQFSLLGSEFIDNDYYYVNFSGKENQLFGVNSHCNAIDIYVLGESTTWNGAGLADDIPSTALIVHGDYYNTTTLPHEMGHCLGLYHTHHGTVNEGGGDINQCPELVDGSNSIVCGDYVQDTPADPNQWSSSSCAYTGTGTDANGEQYSPDASNLMSYAYNPCRNLFSELQISRLKDFIDNTTILQNVFHSYISSPSIVCTTGDIFKVNNLPPVDSIIWSTGPGLTIFSGQNTNSPVIKAIGNGSTWVGVRLVNDCGNITLPQKTIFAGAPYTPVIDGSNYITCDNELFTEGNNKTVTWSVYGPMQIVGQTYGYRCTIEGTGNGYGWVYATASSECDTTTSELFVEVDCGYLLVFSPNPASGETILSIESTSEKKIVDETIDWELEVYDNTQNLKLKNSKVKGKEYRFNTSGWKEGIYVARVKYDDKILTGKLVVKR